MVSFGVVCHWSSSAQHCSYRSNQLITHLHGRSLRPSFGRWSIAFVIVLWPMCVTMTRTRGLESSGWAPGQFKLLHELGFPGIW
ncbi:hypothetical protein BDR03DRAFT_960563 [Suillus americanus]|nr:hypothetical protein BDR03DRAFT_960563 [Suillus americanus]